MKHYLAVLIFFSLCTAAFCAESSGDELIDRLQKRVKIGTVSDSTARTDGGEKVLNLKLHTYQDERDSDYDFRLRVTVELTDKEDKIYAAQLQSPQGGVPKEYTGEDDWEFQVSLGELDKPKMTSYVIEYGILRNKEFVPVAVLLKKAESSADIMKRSAGRVPIKRTHHSVWYRED